jgi:hypothetical protein
MGIKIFRLTRFLLLLAIALAGSGCAKQEASDENTVAHVAATPTPRVGSRAGAQPTATAKIMHPTSAVPVTMTAGQPLDCVTGPHWILYDYVTGIIKGEVLTLTARSTPEWPDYYYVRKSNGKECWAYGVGSLIDGDPLSLPEKEAPPLPEVTYRIENQTGLPICSLYIRKSNETAWGADRLPSGAGAPGTAFGIKIVAGFYDVQILDCYGGKLFEMEDTAVGSKEIFRYVRVDTLVTFSIVNESGGNICWIQYHRHAESGWQDITGMFDAALPDGAVKYFTTLAGKYDFRAHECYETNYRLAFSADDVAISPVGVTVTIT